MPRPAARFCLAAVLCVTACATSSHAVAPAVGSPAPPINLKTLQGNAVTLAELTKDGPAVVVVLRGWPGYQCPLCQRQYGSFRGKADAFAAANVPVLMVYPGPAEKLAEHAAEFVGATAVPPGFSVVVDPDYTFTHAWGLRWDAPKETAYPSTFVVDGGGIVRYAKVSKGHGDRADPEAALAAAKAATTRPAAE